MQQRYIPAALLLALLGAGSGASAEQWKYSTGFDYSSGDYGGDAVDTDILYLPFTAAYQSGRWTYKGTAALLQIDGPGNVIGAGGDGVVIGGGASEAETESGVGDVWLGASYEITEVPAELFYLNLGAKIKLPTADEDKGLGTGEVDYSLVADVFKPVDEFTPFATLSYKIKGDPSGYKLDNVIALSVGSDYRLNGDQNCGLSLDYQEAATSASDDALELFGYFNQRLSGNYSVMLYGYTGLQDGSPDYGLGVQFTYKP